MTEDVYKKVAEVLDTLPQGFPATESGLELKILRKIFNPEQAELFCELRMTVESAKEISERTGRPLEELRDQLDQMVKDCLIAGPTVKGVTHYRMMPYAVGIYELQMPIMDKEFAELNDEYMNTFLKGLLGRGPALAQTIPVEEELPSTQAPATYQQLSNVLDTMQSFRVSDCTCRKEHDLLDKRCDKPMGICIGISSVPGIYEKQTRGRVITREEAKQYLKEAEEAGLVHLTSNYEENQFYICNCCECCCGILRGINRLGLPAWDVVNCDYYAVIDEDLCVSCGVCADERCQVHAIDEDDDSYEIIAEKCIGCGLCISTCPTEAISLVMKSEDQLKRPPKNESDWLHKRAAMRGTDFSKYE